MCEKTERSIHWLASLLSFLFCVIAAVCGAPWYGYHPNHPSTPYWLAAFGIGVIFTCATTLLAITFSLSSANRFLVKRKRAIVIWVYLTLGSIALILLGQAIFSPKYVTQYIGNDAYQVPKVFTRRGEGELNLTMSAETLEGLYEPQRSSSVSLDDIVQITSNSEVLFSEVSRHFKRIPGVSLKDGTIMFDGDRAQYQILATEEWQAYTLQKESTHKLNNESSITAFDPFVKVHVQVTDEDRLVRFVVCYQSTRHGRRSNICDHRVKTELGWLTYKDHVSLGFEPERWQKTTDGLVNLISSWRVVS